MRWEGSDPTALFPCVMTAAFGDMLPRQSTALIGMDGCIIDPSAVSPWLQVFIRGFHSSMTYISRVRREEPDLPPPCPLDSHHSLRLSGWTRKCLPTKHGEIGNSHILNRQIRRGTEHVRTVTVGPTPESSKDRRRSQGRCCLSSVPSVSPRTCLLLTMLSIAPISK